MRNRSLLGALLIIGVLIPITSCTSSPSLTSIAVTPNAVNFGGQGVTSQLTAIGNYTHPGHPPITKDITDQVTWATSADQCVTVTKTGYITSGGNVCSGILISASMPGFNGLITGTMTVNVTQPSGGSGGGGTGNVDVTTIAIIPTSQSVQSPGETAQFLAIGTASNGATVNLTNLVTWASSSVQIATITAGGTATAVGPGHRNDHCTLHESRWNSGNGSRDVHRDWRGCRGGHCTHDYPRLGGACSFANRLSSSRLARLAADWRPMLPARPI